MRIQAEVISIQANSTGKVEIALIDQTGDRHVLLMDTDNAEALATGIPGEVFKITGIA